MKLATQPNPRTPPKTTTPKHQLPWTLLACAVLLGAALLVVVPVPSVEAAPAPTARVLTIDTASANPTVPFEAFDAAPPKVFDFNGDGKKEIVVQNDNRYVYVFDSKTGALLSELQTKYPGGWGARPINGPEAVVLVEGGVPHVVVANSASYITLFRYEDSASNPGHFQFTKLWERRLNDCEPNPGMDSKPVLADLDGDGDLEILAYTEEKGGFALRLDGSIMWKTCISGGNSEPAVADLNFDGTLEVVWVSDGGVVTVSNGQTGATKWTFWAGHPQYNLGAASIPVGATIAQVDGVGPLDIVFGARDSHDRYDFSKNHAALFVVKGSGGLLWMRQDFNGGAPLTYTHPIVYDIDGNGKADVFWADWNTVGHKPPFPGDPTNAWQITGPAHFYRYDSTGNLVWKQTMNTYWNNKDLALADIDEDGVQELFANGPGHNGDGIWYLNGITGAKETFIGTTPWKVSRGPIVEDLWNTGTMQWIVPVEAATNAVSGGAILVYDTHAAYNAAWPHLPYPTAGGGTPPPTGDFDATFTIKNPNQWWQEVTANPSPARAITGMSIRINDGGWNPMTMSSWGAWTSSHHTVAGTKVEFRAMDAGNFASQSAPFTWLDGVHTKGSVPLSTPPPPSGTFEATFKVPGSVNNWWVEVEVASVHAIASVTATVDGGTPIDLPHQSWGNWAKSFFVATGSTVVFKATNTVGDSVTSDPFQWLGSAPPPPPPPSGDFTATFQVPGSVNNWWVEVKVTGNHPVGTVTATVDGGAPVALTKQSWGNWAKSFHVPSGAKVQFTATDTDGAAVKSTTYTWLSSGGAFTATFKPSDPSNNWWVEVSVTSSQPPASVEAQVNGGAWVNLPKTSWGTWAKSFFVPDGANVVFRATSTGGTVVTSQTVVWI